MHIMHYDNSLKYCWMAKKEPFMAHTKNKRPIAGEPTGAQVGWPWRRAIVRLFAPVIYLFSASPHGLASVMLMAVIAFMV